MTQQTMTQAGIQAEQTKQANQTNQMSLDSEPGQIEREALAGLIGSDSLTLVEALPLPYYQSGHLPGARHLPHTATEAEIAAVLPDLSQAVVVYCASETCRNSDQLAARLLRLGYVDVAIYRGGKADWQDAGLSLEA